MTRVVRGAALGATWAGLTAAAHAAAGSLDPTWASLASANTALPWIGPGLDAVRGWAIQALILLLLVGLSGRVASGRKGPGVTAPLLLGVSGLILSGAGGVESVGVWLLTGLATERAGPSEGSARASSP